MISDRSKELFEQLHMPYPAIAIRFHVCRLLQQIGTWHDPQAFREDEESREELKRRMNHWQEMAQELDSTVDLR